MRNWTTKYRNTCRHCSNSSTHSTPPLRRCCYHTTAEDIIVRHLLVYTTFTELLLLLALRETRYISRRFAACNRPPSRLRIAL
jgi:hypothetical protein